jgi:ICP0-binding domain of Ubiquitin-specific protease 7
MVYVVPSSLDKSERLIFVKHYDWEAENPTLTYSGPLSVSGCTILRDKLRHMIRIGQCAEEPPLEPVEVLAVISTKEIKLLDTSASVQELELSSGSVIVVQADGISVDRQGPLPLAYGPHGHTLRSVPVCGHLVLVALFNQTLQGDVIMSTWPTRARPYQLRVHKSMLSLIPYFKATFTNGMYESVNGRDPIHLKVGIDVEEHILREFLAFLYIRDCRRLGELSPASLISLLPLSDYYGFEELTQAVVNALGKLYAYFTGDLALQVLTTIHPLQFANKSALERVALDYIAYNFACVGKLPAFREQLDDEIYGKAVDNVARTRC